MLLSWVKARTLYTNGISHFYHVIPQMTNLIKELNISACAGKNRQSREEIEKLKREATFRGDAIPRIFEE